MHTFLTALDADAVHIAVGAGHITYLAHAVGIEVLALLIADRTAAAHPLVRAVKTAFITHAIYPIVRAKGVTGVAYTVLEEVGADL